MQSPEWYEGKPKRLYGEKILVLHEKIKENLGKRKLK